ncbi:esterase family protein [Mangrovimonas sp. TPBH4]|uniref:alpha/beta hydrolase n=1 Tax=Mangrovimonas sp. TPBH4 TaxID=1645914 RepID=UPI001E392F7D|nr:alpha/beta hydrolase-fold protein [Mangrovimonas sp. TPBH4]
MKNVVFVIGCSILLTFSCNSKLEKGNATSQFFTDSIYSKNLSEYRKHSVYLPKEFNPSKQYPIMYANDGNSNLTQKKHLLDSLIANQIIKPLIFVASFSNSKIADSTSTTTGDGKKVYLTYRNFEYIDRQPFREEDSLLIHRFKNHKAYFIEEFIPEIESKYRQKPEKDNRYFYGVSNGAGFGMSLLNSHPNIIGTYLCFSTFGGDIQSYTWHSNIQYPNLYLRYGSEEPFFLKEDAEFIMAKYTALKAFAEIQEFEGGHDNSLWNETFIDVARRLFALE